MTNFKNGRSVKRRLSGTKRATQALLIEFRPLQYGLELETMKNYRALGRVSARQAGCDNFDDHSGYVDYVLEHNKQSFICQPFHLFTVDGFFRRLRHKIENTKGAEKQTAARGVQLFSDDPGQETTRMQRQSL